MLMGKVKDKLNQSFVQEVRSLLRASLYFVLKKRVSLAMKSALEFSPPWGRKRASSLQWCCSHDPRRSKEECRQQSCGWAAVCRQHGCLVTFLGALFLNLDCASYSKLSSQSCSCDAFSDWMTSLPVPHHHALLLLWSYKSSALLVWSLLKIAVSQKAQLWFLQKIKPFLIK